MKLYKTNLIALLAIAFIMNGCDADTKQTLEERSWQLTWSDEFEGEAGQALDATKWTYDLGRGDNGWGNQELQYYTDRTDNVSLDGEGNMRITAKSESFSGAPFTSGRIKTQGLFSQKYGRFEARMKTPYGPGLWPAFWLLGSNITEVNWPQCGEIDILELRGQEPNIIHGSIHGPGYSAGNAISKSYGFTDERYDTEFHVIAIEWGEDFIEYFVDDILYNRIDAEDVLPNEWVYNNDFFMIFNVVVGGNYVGFPTSQTPFPQHMIVDYVRVYK